MKRLIDAVEVAAYRNRVAAGTPFGLRRYLEGVVDGRRTEDVFPRPRFWLWLEMWCPRLAGEKNPYDFIDLQVFVFYRGVLPFLAYGMDDSAALRRGTALVDLLDELMNNEDRWYASAMPWPLADVLRVFADVFTAFYFAPPRDVYAAWDLGEQNWLKRNFAEVIRALEAHEDCCAEIRVNVHWW